MHRSHSKPTGLSFSNPQNGLRFARQESTEMIACATIGGEPCLTSATLHKLSILCLLSYDAQRLYALWIPNLNPVGFCVVCAFCGDYKQRRYKYKILIPDNCNLQFYHSKFRMNRILFVEVQPFYLMPYITKGTAWLWSLR